MAATKSNAPWSVKGIDRDARETAKEAAQKEGMTVGAWLNLMIYNAGAPESSGGFVDGLEAKDVVTAIEALNTRVATAEDESAKAIDKLARNFGGVVERVQRLERGGGDAEVGERLTRLEEKSTDRQRIDTLKALEKAVGQVALQFNTAHKESIQRLDAQEKQLQQLAGRFEGAEGDPQAASAINYLKNAVDGMAARISRAERIASEASKISAGTNEPVDSEFVEQTGARLRILGDEIKRGGDQIRSLEDTIVKLSSQIDAAEKRSAEGVHKVSETIVELREQFSTASTTETPDKEELEAVVAAATQQTEERISSLQSSFDDMIARLEQSEFDDDELASFDALAGFEQQSPEPQIEPETAEDTQSPDATFEAVDATDDIDDIFDLDEPEETSAEERDEFSVDLDDDASLDEVATETSEDDILSQVREALGQENETPSANLDTPAVPDATQGDGEKSDLDMVLAELDSMGISNEQPATDDTAASVETPELTTPASLLDESALTPDTNVNEDVVPADAPATSQDPLRVNEDQIQTQENDAVEDKSSPLIAEKPLTKRQLTPKQRAILAARIRRKKREAEEARIAAEKEQQASDAVKSELAQSSTDEELDDEDNSHSLFAKIGAAFSGLRARLPGGANAEDDDDDEDDQPVEAAQAVEQVEIEESDDDDADKKPSALSNRPLSIALGVSIFLAVIALFFIVKDVFLSQPSNNAATRIPVAAGTPSSGTAGPTAEETMAFNEANSASTVQPRDLYLDSVTELQAAATPEEELLAIQKMQESAALGHPPAQLQMGEFYKTGQGFDQDLTQARTWYERAATGGNVLAMHRVGVMTAQGEGGSADINEAITWFEKAANHSLVDSQYNLGAIYHPSADGAVGIQNAEQAYYWYSLAAKNGDDQASSLAAGLRGSISPAAKADLDNSVNAWTSTPANPTANEVSPAS